MVPNTVVKYPLTEKLRVMLPKRMVTTVPVNASNIAMTANWSEPNFSKNSVKAQTLIMPMANPDMNMLLNNNATSEDSWGRIPSALSQPAFFTVSGGSAKRVIRFVTDA